MTDYIVAAVGNWNRKIFQQKATALDGNFYFVETPEELVEILEQVSSPRYIFFLHWRWIVPKSVVREYECICFHMTDVPFGRGGSPLQNLIIRGYKDTVLTSLRMDEGIDSGPVYLKYPLCLDGSAAEIYERSANLSWNMIDEIIYTKPTPQQQNGPVVKFKRRLPEQSEIPQNLKLAEVYDYIRMLDAEGYPRAFLEDGSYSLTFEHAQIHDEEIIANVSIRIRKKLI